VTDQPDLGAAFDELRAVVSDLVERGRKPLVQGVKPTLQRRSGGQFDENALGFASFGDFVHAAELAGAVHTRPAPGGRLVEPGPPARDARALLAAEPTRVRQPRLQIRRELWRAFTDWSGRRDYAWDRTRQAVVAWRLESHDAGSASTAFVPISPIPEEEQIQWAQNFLAEHTASPVIEPLTTILGGGLGSFVVFSRFIRTDRELTAEWAARRKHLVADAIREWAQQHGLEVDPYSSVGRGSFATETPPEAPQDGVERLRTAVKRAIDQMSPAELRELRLPVGSLEGSGF
jgi:hypothetical protein